jgi:Eukaryotic aspartyl protease
MLVAKILFFWLLLKLLELKYCVDTVNAAVFKNIDNAQSTKKDNIDSATCKTGTDNSKDQLSALAINLHHKYGSYHASVLYRNSTYNLIVDTGSRITAWKNCPSIIRGTSSAPFQQYVRKCPDCTLVNDINYCNAYSINNETNVSANKRRRRNSISSGKNLPVWLIAQANTASSKYCVVRQKYVEGSSWSGYEVVDNITLSGTLRSKSMSHHLLHSFRITFACQFSLKGNFRTQQYSHGILGLKPNVNSTHSMFIESLFRSNIIYHRSFSLCLSANAGVLSLGGYRRPTHDTAIRYTPVIQKSSYGNYYTVIVEEFWLGNTCLTCNETANTNEHASFILQSFNSDKGTIVDSGTTDSYFPKALASTFDDEWSQYIVGYQRNAFNRGLQRCTISEYQKLPNITIVLANDVKIVLSPSTYMKTNVQLHTMHNLESKIELMNQIFFTESVGAVLGSNSMIGYNVIFDTDNNQIGYGQANC